MQLVGLGTILLSIAILALVGVLAVWPQASSWGYGPTGLVGMLFLAMALGCASTAKQEGTGEYVDDTVITTKVKAAICAAEAKGKASVAKADALAAYKHTPEVRQNARIARAQANYNVAIEKCDALAGPAKDARVGNAQAQYGKP